MSSLFPSNAKALYQAGSLMSKINERLAGNQQKDIEKDMVDQMKLTSTVKAQVNTLKTIDEMVGAQIDLIA